MQVNKKGKTVESKKIQQCFFQAIVCLSLSAFHLQATAADKEGTQAVQPLYAKVGEVDITQRQFDSAYAQAASKKFYHGKPPEAEVSALRDEIGEKLITNALLLIEAKKIKLKPDDKVVNQKLKQFEQRNAGNPNWKKMREGAIPALTRAYEEQNLRYQMEERARKVKSPTEKQLKQYYSAHKDKFTEPEQVSVSLILLKVDPTSTKETWESAREFGRGLIKQINEGADFAELARKYSGDKDTADQGGNMGYLHGGMMSGLPELIVKGLKAGEISDVSNLMEGVAIFKLNERIEPKLNNFDQVKERVQALWVEEEKERVWKSFIAKLKKETTVKVYESSSAKW